MPHSLGQISCLKHILKIIFISALLLVPFHFLQAEEDPGGYRLGPSLTEPEPTTLPSEDADKFHFDPRDWNEMRRAVEEGREPGVPTVQAVETSTITAEAPKAPPGQIKLDLPYESSLSVTGRKVIKIDLKNTHISKERANELGGKQDSQTFNMEQELQARIQGTVARKTTINVNFDDTKENVRDFSVIYKGDPDEVVQEAAFGDITLSLPSTEFVNYNKQLFGIRAALKYKKFGFMAIGSRTKGTTETKRFVGSTTRNQSFINDTDYIRRRYYDLTFSTSVSAGGMNTIGVNSGSVLPISDAQPEIVFMEDTTGLVTSAQDYLIATPTAPVNPPIVIRMRQLSRGVDYSIDRIKGIVTFTNEVPESARVAIVFTLADGTRLDGSRGGIDDPGNAAVAVLIKDKSPEAPEVSQEIKRFYSAKARNIIKDNGLGNFVFKVLDKNRETEIGNSLTPIQRYPDNIEMDFINGIFKLNSFLPFSDVYAPNVSAATPLQAVFSVEFQAILRTFSLRPNIVLQSESVQVDGRKVNRDLDYFIDYDIGLITFFNSDLIRESTVIEVTYEFAPFGGTLGETLVGARGTYDIFNNKKIGGVGVESWSAGSTVLYNFAAKPTAPPDIRATPASLLVTEGDSQVKGLQFGKIPVITNFSMESAQSKQDPNLFGKAIVDSFEGLKQEDSAPMIEDLWQVSANPDVAPFNPTADFRGRDNPASHLTWADIDIQTLDPNDESATQKALAIGYSLNSINTTTPEQVSMLNIISNAGRDFSKKTTLEIEVSGAGAAGADVDLIVDYGTFNEDSDGDNDLDTEDRNPFDGALNLGEDIGWIYDSPGNDLTRATADDLTVGIGGGNARLDSEDLNNDKSLNKTDTSATNTPLFVMSSTQTDSLGRTSFDLSFPASERRLFQIPLNVSALTVDEQNKLTAVRQVRVTIRNKAGATNSRVGSIVLARVSMVGISWDPAEMTGTVGSTMTVRAVNNKDDPTYKTLVGNGDYNSLYKDAAPTGDDFKEQALALNYNLLGNSTGTTVDKFGAVRDFSKHDQFKFFLQRRDNIVGEGGYFFLRAGSETDYQQAAINLANVPSGTWLTVTLGQADTNGDGFPETWVSQTPGVTVTRVGTVPNLTQVAQLKAGVVNDTGATIQNEIWINEIHVSGSHERVGHAQKYSADSTWTNWMDFGWTARDVDRNWQTPTTPITNQDREETSAYVNFNRLSVLPMTFKTSKDITKTPSAFQSNQNALVSVLDEGRVENTHNAATANLLIPKLPQISFNFNEDDSENTVTKRKESSNLWRIGATYSPLTRLDLLPGKILTFQPIPSAITLSYSRKNTLVDYMGTGAELATAGISTTPFSSTDIAQITEETEARLAFGFWNGFTFNPTYKLKVDKDKRMFRDDETTAPGLNLGDLDGKETPRAVAQSVSASGNLRLLKWLDPRYNYSYSGTETNNLTTLTNTTGYLLKSIDRTSQGELSAAIQANQILTRSKLLNSMNLNTSYKVENGDSYENIPDDFSWKSQLWVGTPLNISSGSNDLARKTASTDRRTFRLNTSWIPLSGYQIVSERFKPFSSMSITSNYLKTTEDSETTGTTKRIVSETLPDLIVTLNDTEDLFGVTRVIDESRLILKDNVRKENVIGISKSKTNSFGTDYQFKFYKKWDVSTSFSISSSRQDNLVSSLLSNQSETKNYSVQTRIPKGNWAYTPRYQRNETDARDAVNITNDLRSDTISLQIYGDINRPLGIRIGRYELGVANRLILNSTLQWEKRRSAINPSTNYLDLYTATLSGDYTLSKNFRMAIGGNISQEVHHPDFSKLDQNIFGLNTTLTIQF